MAVTVASAPRASKPRLIEPERDREVALGHHQSLVGAHGGDSQPR